MNTIHISIFEPINYQLHIFNLARFYRTAKTNKKPPRGGGEKIEEKIIDGLR